MKAFKRMTTVFLCLVLLLTGCGAPGGQAGNGAVAGASAPNGADGTGPVGTGIGAASSAGKYIETDITPPLLAGRSVAALHIWPDGTLYCLAYDAKTAELYTTADCGETWEQRTALCFDEIHPGGRTDTCRFAAARDGSVYYAYRLKDGGDTGAHLWHAAPDGAVEELCVDVLEEHNRKNEAMWLYALRLGGDGRLLLHAMVFPAGQEGYDTGVHKVFVIDPQTGRCEREIPVSGSFVSAFGQSGYYELGYDGRLTRYDYASGESEALGMLDTGTGDDMEKQAAAKIALLDEETHTFAILSHDDLRIAAPGGALTEILCTGGYTFSDPRLGISRLAAMPDDSFVVCFASERSVKLCRYAFDGSAPAVPAAQTMTVWALDDSDALRSAIAEFGALHPETEVVLELGHTAAGGDMQDNDIIAALNTRLLAGDAPDLLILDGLPARGYIQKGALQDLSGLVDGSDYFANILNAWKTDGGVWAYPTFARLCALVTEPTLQLAPASLAQLAEAVVQGPPAAQGYDALPLEQQALMATNNGRDLIETLYPAVSAQIFPDGAALDEDALRAFYASLAAIAQRHGIADEDWAYTTVGGEVLVSDLHTRFCTERSRAAAIIIEGFHSTISPVARRDAAVQLMPGEAYVPVLNAAVPAKAAQPELAREMIRDVLLGSAIQADPGTLEGLPVSRRSFAEAHREYVAALRVRVANQPSEEYGIPEPYMEKAFAQDLAALMEQASLRAEQSVLLRDAVEENMRAVLRGECSVDEAVVQTAADVRLYFAEQG